MTDIVVDFREEKEVPEVVMALRDAGFSVEVMELEAGDYWFPSTASLVERKTPEDFVGSVADRRLFDQLQRMKQAENASPFLLIDGPLERILKFTQWRPKSVCALLVSVQRDWGVHVLFAQNRKWLMAFLLSLVREGGKRSYPLRFVPKDRPLWEIQRGVVEGIPGVSAVRADALLRHFGTIRELVLADESRLTEVEGIGEKTARKIREVFDTPYSPETL